MVQRWLVVTVDTEIDHDRSWRISDPPRFSSVVQGISEVLTPLFDQYGVVPTYLLSPEVIEDPTCVATLRRLGSRAELGTHLHLDFIEPHRRLFHYNMGGQRNTAVQMQVPVEIETKKLENVTRFFADAFGFKPTSFRAGRFGMSRETLRILAQLGYTVDSSVTPGLCWEYEGTRIDYRLWSPQPAWMDTPAGAILELPLSIRPGSRLAPIVREFPFLPRRITTRLLGRFAGYQWLRPSWNSGEDLIRYARESSERLLVLMLHSMEVIAGASPYAVSFEDVRRIVGSMDTLFRYWKDAGHDFCSMRDATEHVTHNHA